MRIAIDPGHGGKDPGAVANGLQEKDITLAISLQTASILRAAGQIVIMTRETDRFIDLTAERAPASDISISIHVNSGGGQGLETWVSLFNKPAESMRLGQEIQNSVLKRVAFRDRGLKTKKNSAGTADYLYMLRKPAGVAVLVECGFTDSSVDADILKSADNLTMIARGIAAGVLDYLGVKVEEKEDDEMIYKTLNDVPDWGKPIVQKLISRKSIVGDGKGDINLPESTLKTLAILEREGVLK